MESKMKYYLLSFITIISIVILFDGCSKLQENITQPKTISIHSKGDLDTSSTNFHGNVLKANNFNLDGCKQCHAANFQGGITDVSCYNCHNYPHQQGYLDTTSVNFHGTVLKANNFSTDACSRCHAADFKGGNTNISCIGCHNYPHPQGMTDSTSSSFHGKIIMANKFVMDECQKCHGNDFSGNGSSLLNCRTCHTQPEGPLACNTCHGNFGDPTKIAPPRDINGNTSTDFITVGAHISHLYENDLAVVACENCHKVPNANNIKDHFNPGPLVKIVVLDSLAIHGIASNAAFDTNTGTCSNTYCHGNFEFKKSDASTERQFAYTSDKMTGNYKTVKWNILDGSQAPCGSCHGTADGFISPEGHIKLPIQQCVACHSTVVNAKGEIIDKTRHINGLINYALGKKR
jgi:predicted CxxxxCH...CXXCH cytochrome family protein